MVLDDLVRNRKTEACSFAFRLGGKEGFGGSLGDLLADPNAVVGHDERHMLPLALHRKGDLTPLTASITSVEKQVDEYLLEEASIASDLGEVCAKINVQLNLTLLESVLDEPGRRPSESRRIAALQGGLAPARESQEAANDGKDTFGLIRDDLHGSSRSIVGLPGEQLLGTTQNHSEGGRHLMRNPRGQCTHGRKLVGAYQTFVAFSSYLGERQLMCQL